MADVSLAVFNADELMRALTQAPQLAHAYAKTEIGRIGNRVKKAFIRERMSGAPGINGGEWKRQHKRHVRVQVEGDRLDTLAVRIQLSRFLALHEEGGTIRAHQKGAKFLRIPIGDRRGLAFRGKRFQRTEDGYIQGLVLIPRKGRQPLLAEKVNGQLVPRYVLVESATIKPRLGFRATTTRLFGEHVHTLDGAIERAIRKSLDDQMRQVVNLVRAA